MGGSGGALSSFAAWSGARVGRKERRGRGKGSRRRITESAEVEHTLAQRGPWAVEQPVHWSLEQRLVRR